MATTIEFVRCISPVLCSGKADRVPEAFTRYDPHEIFADSLNTSFVWGCGQESAAASQGTRGISALSKRRTYKQQRCIRLGA